MAFPRAMIFNHFSSHGTYKLTRGLLHEFMHGWGLDGLPQWGPIWLGLQRGGAIGSWPASPAAYRPTLHPCTVWASWGEGLWVVWSHPRLGSGDQSANINYTLLKVPSLINIRYI